MKRNKNLVPLSRQHHYGLILAQLVKKDAPEYRGLPTDTEGKRAYVLKEWEERLQSHFEIEEKFLFPTLIAENILEMEVKELISQHRQIRRLIDQLREENEVVYHLNTLGHLLEKHIRKEERELFQKAQELLSKEKLDEIGDLIASHL
jgi:iron-sulfur cluster repair protein YtfE (RIC family)